MPIDLRAVTIDGMPKLFVSLDDARTGRVYEYSDEGVLARYWSFPNKISGLAFDEVSQILYVAGLDDIYSINLRGDAEVKWIASGPGGATNSRPILLDADRKPLYVADGNVGDIYEFNLQNHQRRVFARGTGFPNAFLISHDRDLLYYVNSAFHVS